MTNHRALTYQSSYQFMTTLFIHVGKQIRDLHAITHSYGGFFLSKDKGNKDKYCSLNKLG